MPSYVCQREGIATGQPISTLPGRALDHRIGVLPFLTPLTIEAAFTVTCELEHRAEQPTPCPRRTPAAGNPRGPNGYRWLVASCCTPNQRCRSRSDVPGSGSCAPWRRTPPTRTDMLRTPHHDTIGLVQRGTGNTFARPREDS